MSVHVSAVCVLARQPAQLARFWSSLLGWDLVDDVTLVPSDDTGFALRFEGTDEPKSSQNRAHLDLTSSSEEGQQRTVARAIELGGRHVDVGQRPEEGHVVLGDPEGNEFCVIAPGNAFLADCGFVGALACDGTREVGCFWARALDWPLVWDQDQETAIRSPEGGPKITWGGPPLMARTGRDRVRLEVAPYAGGDQGEEVERLLALGATLVDGAGRAARTVELSDPDGNPFTVLPPREPLHRGPRSR